MRIGWFTDGTVSMRIGWFTDGTVSMRIGWFTDVPPETAVVSMRILLFWPDIENS
jgi:hypothetical protein